MQMLGEMKWNQVANRNNDVQLADFVESEFLGEQVNPKFKNEILYFIGVKIIIILTFIY